MKAKIKVKLGRKGWQKGNQKGDKKHTKREQKTTQNEDIKEAKMRLGGDKRADIIYVKRRHSGKTH